MLERFPLKPYPAWIKVKNLVSLQRKLDLAHKLKMSCSQIKQGKSFWSKYQLRLWLTQHSHSPTPNLQLDLYPQHIWGGGQQSNPLSSWQWGILHRGTQWNGNFGDVTTGMLWCAPGSRHINIFKGRMCGCINPPNGSFTKVSSASCLSAKTKPSLPTFSELCIRCIYSDTHVFLPVSFTKMMLTFEINTNEIISPARKSPKKKHKTSGKYLRVINCILKF